jgi:hypothetical protein
MGAKSQVIEWGILLACLAAAGIGGLYLAKKEIGSIFGASSDGVDLFGNKTAAKQESDIKQAVDASSQAVQGNIAGLQEYEEQQGYDRQYAALWQQYNADYIAAQQAGQVYQQGVAWNWLGQETGASKARYQDYLALLQKAQADYADMQAYYNKIWG